MLDLPLSSGPGPGDHRQTVDTMSASCVGQPFLVRGQTTRPGDPASSGLGKTSLRREGLGQHLGLVSLDLPVCWASGRVSQLAVSTATVSVWEV